MITFIILGTHKKRNTTRSSKSEFQRFGWQPTIHLDYLLRKCHNWFNNCFRLYLLHQFLTTEDAFGSNETLNIYARKNSPIAKIFAISEVCLFIEVINYMLEIQDMKVHMYCNICQVNFILFLTVDYNSSVSKSFI